MIFGTRRKASRSLSAHRGTERPAIIAAIIEALESRRLLTAITVTTASDAVSHSGVSLRNAVVTANADARAGKSDTITFAASLKGQTITLVQGNIELGLGGAGSGVIAISGAGNPITISGNHASRVFFVDAGVHATFTGLTITAGGATSAITNGAGLFSYGTTTISNCTFAGNDSTFLVGTGGGAIENFNATMTINNSTFFGNSASQGGAIYNHGVLTINDSTFSRNVASAFGGALNNFHTASLTLQSCVVAGNKSSGSSDIGGAVQAASSFNLIGDGSSMTGISNGVAGNKVGNSTAPINPKLAPLAYYGGTTQTMALLAGSPAINAGGPKAGVNFPKDQNGRSRVGTADIGAYEATTSVKFGSQVVTTTSDALVHAGVSLRDAVGRVQVDAANGHSDTITFASSLKGKTITLDRDQGQLELAGAGSGVTTIDGAKQITISANTTGRVLLVDAGVKTVFTGLTIADGGDLTGTLAGAGIFSYGTTTISNCSFTGNSTTFFSGTGGGAVENFNATMTINNSTFSANTSSQGGAIYNHGAMTVNSCLFQENQAAFGGAINNFRTANLAVNNSIFFDNSASRDSRVGGGIHNDGTLTVNAVTFSDNDALIGGGINNSTTGKLTVSNNTQFLNNTAAFGGGINNNNALTISASEFSNNAVSKDGGGIYNNGTVSVSTSTFTANSTGGGSFSSGNGGGIFNNGALLTVKASTFSGNSANGEDGTGGGIDNLRALIISNSTFTGNSAKVHGGGIGNGGALTVTGSTFCVNSAKGVLQGNGGGISNDGSASVSNTTFFKNSAVIIGGAIDNSGALTVSNSTLSANSAAFGGGIESSSIGSVTLLNTLVAGNTASGASNPDIDGPVESSSTFNLIGNGSGMTGITNGNGGNLVGTNAHPIPAGLLPLDFNGGPTQTMALTSGSAARNAGGRLTSLTAAITSKTASKITVSLAAVFAASPSTLLPGFVIKIDSEQMLVKSVGNANTLTVDRGYNGTAAATHALGAKVFLATDQRGHARNGVPDIGAYEF